MKELIIIFCLALVIDLIIGDPENITHPVVIIGKFISWLEELLHQGGNSANLIFRGGLLVAIVVVTVYLTTALIISVSYQLNYWLGIIVSAWLFSTCLATKSLKRAAMAIHLPLINNDLSTAREKLGYVVSRETANLPQEEIARGAVETVAENTVDGVIAPLVYGIIGGPALAMTYKSINTLDSMLGYKNECYYYFGRIAARLDDLANYLPARITGLFMLLAASVMRLPVKKALQSWKAFAHLHPSPNGGIPESVVAGALGIRLGGYNWYHGQKNFRAFMGEREREIVPSDIAVTVKIMYLTTLILSGFIMMLLIGLLLRGGTA